LANPPANQLLQQNRHTPGCKTSQRLLVRYQTIADVQQASEIFSGRLPIEPGLRPDGLAAFPLRILVFRPFIDAMS
jgi:hypothetical protein